MTTAYESATWSEVRSAVLRIRSTWNGDGKAHRTASGGIRIDADYASHDIPGDLARLDGRPLDEVAAELHANHLVTTADPDECLAELRAMYASHQRAQVSDGDAEQFAAQLERALAETDRGRFAVHLDSVISKYGRRRVSFALLRRRWVDAWESGEMVTVALPDGSSAAGVVTLSGKHSRNPRFWLKRRGAAPVELTADMELAS